MPRKKVYLGDSVYAEQNDYGVTLTTENGLGPTNTIMMEPDVIRNFLDYWKELRKA